MCVRPHSVLTGWPAGVLHWQALCPCVPTKAASWRTVVVGSFLLLHPTLKNSPPTERRRACWHLWSCAFVMEFIPRGWSLPYAGAFLFTLNMWNRTTTNWSWNVMSVQQQGLVRSSTYLLTQVPESCGCLRADTFWSELCRTKVYYILFCSVLHGMCAISTWYRHWPDTTFGLSSRLVVRYLRSVAVERADTFCILCLFA